MPKKRKLGILTFSDGRKTVHEELLGVNQGFLDQLVKTLEATGELDLVVGQKIIYQAEQAKEEAERLKAARVDGTILNFSIWSFPHLPVIAAENGRGPFLLLSNLNPNYPGLIAMLAAAGCLDQLGIRHSRLWGNVNDQAVIDRIIQFSRVSSVVNRLKGETCGLFGGRSMGMYIGAVDTRQWQTEFGVDLEHVDQYEIVIRSEKIPEKRVEKAFQWLSDHVGKIVYDGKGLTPEKLKTQIRSYLATKEIIQERGFHFVGIKCQPELSDHFVTQCLSQAFLNDPYDMEGEKETIPCGCEADLDGALTMEVLKHLTDSPVLFFDLRHYDAANDMFVFSNCGSQSTYFAGHSLDPKVNLKRVTFYPQTPFYYKAGGAAVQYMCAEGEITLARLARKNGKYWMGIIPGKFIKVSEEKMKETSPEWPQGFTKLSVNAAHLISGLGGNHVHAVYGHVAEELKEYCAMMGIEAKVFS
jgi:L-fucose isomerase